MINFTNHPYDMWDERQKEEGLQFLYDTGLGSRNSQGFGMFEQVWGKYEIIR